MFGLLFCFYNCDGTIANLNKMTSSLAAYVVGSQYIHLVFIVFIV